MTWPQRIIQQGINEQNETGGYHKALKWEMHSRSVGVLGDIDKGGLSLNICVRFAVSAAAATCFRDVWAGQSTRGQQRDGESNFTTFSFARPFLLPLNSVRARMQHHVLTATQGSLHKAVYSWWMASHHQSCPIQCREDPPRRYPRCGSLP